MLIQKLSQIKKLGKVISKCQPGLHYLYAHDGGIFDVVFRDNNGNGAYDIIGYEKNNIEENGFDSDQT